MTTLIAYASKHGCTEKTAKILAEGIDGKVDLLNLKEAKEVDFSLYNKIVVGGSIHNSKMNMLVTDFVDEYTKILRTKKCGFYICSMDNDERTEQYMQESFPLVLLQNAFAIGYFGGEFDFDKMDEMEKMLIEKIAGVSENVSAINYENITQFINLANCHKKNVPQ